LWLRSRPVASSASDVMLIQATLAPPVGDYVELRLDTNFNITILAG
jgi:hypothetical protein